MIDLPSSPMAIPPLREHRDLVTDDLRERLRTLEDEVRQQRALLAALPERILETVPALKPLLAVRDVAATLGVSTRTVETLIAEGELRPLWVKGQRRFHPDAVDAYVRSRAIQGRRAA